MRACMEYCYRFRDSAPKCYVDMQDKLQRRGYKGGGGTPVAFLEPLARRRNVVSLNQF